MNKWEEVRLKSLVIEMGDGGTPTTTESDNFGGDIPWVVVDDVQSEIWTTKDTLTDKGFGKCSAKLWNKETIILTTGATIGKVGIAKVKLCTKQGITGIVCNQYANNYFIRYWFEANTNQLLRYAQGTTFKEIRTRALGNLRIKLPNPGTIESVNEQTAIASILTKVDEAILATQNSIKAAEKLKKSLMQNLLSGKLKPDGTWRTEDEFYVDEKFGNVPKGWEVKPVGDKSICNINPNYKYIKGRLYDFIPMDGINDSFRGVGYSELQKIDGGGYTRFKLGDILFAKITPCTENGKVALIEKMNTEVGFASTEFIIFQVKETTDNIFFYYLLSSDKVHKLAVSLMEGTTGRQRVPWKVFKNRISMPIPNDISEQKSIASKLKSIELSNIEKQNKIETLQRLKKSLMQNLLTGKVRVDVEKTLELCQEK